jgi:plastocyanin
VGFEAGQAPLNRSRWRHSLIALGLFGAAIPAVADEAPAPPSRQISIHDLAFNPATLTVKRGRVVDWSNNDAAIHIIVSDDGGFRSPPLESHDVFRHKFTTPGTFHFFCSVHPRMMGTIEVK